MGYEIKSDDGDNNEGILSRFRRCLDHGLEFAGRKYFMLDYSASQARYAYVCGVLDLVSRKYHPRTNAFWEICEDPPNGFTRVKVRAFLGDFSGEKIVAK